MTSPFETDTERDDPGEAETTIGDLLRLLRRRWIVLLAGLISGAAIGALLSATATKQYSATSYVLFNSFAVNADLDGFMASRSTPTQSQQDTNIELMRVAMSGAPARATATTLSGHWTAAMVREHLTVAPDSDTSIALVTATAQRPAIAARLANTFAKKYIAYQTGLTRKQLAAPLAILLRKWDAMSQSARSSSTGVNLHARARALVLLTELQSGSIALTRAARTPSSPSSPKRGMDIAIGALLGALFAILLIGVGPRMRLARRVPSNLKGILNRRPSSSTSA